MPEPRSTAPLRITPLPATAEPAAPFSVPNVTLPFIVTGLPLSRIVPSLRSAVPSDTVSVPEPIGPLVTGEPVDDAPNMIAPCVRLKPPANVVADVKPENDSVVEV